MTNKMHFQVVIGERKDYAYIGHIHTYCAMLVGRHCSWSQLTLWGLVRAADWGETPKQAI
jgi:hypothetical protein